MVDRPALRGVRWAAPVARGIRPCSEVIANTPSWQEGAGLLDLARQLSAARNADARTRSRHDADMNAAALPPSGLTASTPVRLYFDSFTAGNVQVPSTTDVSGRYSRTV